ncbi:MAG: ABC transporter substrate-binding protein, partial [Candidatus Promineifilaceae bacterium]
MNKFNFRIILFGLLIFVLAACSDSEILEVPVEVTREVAIVETVVIEPTVVPIQQGGDVVESTFSDINTLNPVLGNDNASATSYNRLFLGLLKLEAFTGRVIGDVAKDWTVSDDGLTYTFNLHDNITWSDGMPLTARDIVFTYDAINHDAVASPRRSGFDSVASWTAPDDYTLEVQLSSLDCSVTTNGLGTGILPAHVYNNDPATIPDSDENLSPSVVSGPFVFVEYIPDDRVVLAANPNYYKGKPNIDTWTYKVYSDQSAELAGLLAGEVNITRPVGPQFVSVVEGAIASGEPMQMRKWLTNGYTFVGLNLANPNNPQNGWDDLDGDGKYTDGEPPLAQDPHPILGDKLVRQAINT